ncbi:thermostable hemolysin [Sulfuriflexus sp.]|uniref:thermostable hemolysin n=1 Tax=Sulfuriflexus sp. TaxID=2015443 RepID=UPI0028CBCADE|nr:thermostable hemolysin [Sulfuriflexus sp.]MDT8403415.1 thermostable hemolysin [Sulfuriflexus sp.]
MMLHVALKDDDGGKNSLYYNSRRLKRFTALTPGMIAITSLYSPERRRVERFLEREFRHTYNANITEHYPTLMSVQNNDGTILGALGFRCANTEKLFLEQYLDTPVETALSAATESGLTRNAIVEVGNLASHANGASIFMFTALTAYLAQRGKQYITVTATDFLHRYFTRLDVDLLLLGYADQTRLPDGGHSWGTYYQTEPRIIAGHITSAYEKLQKHLQMSMVEETALLHAKLHLQSNGRADEE